GAFHTVEGKHNDTFWALSRKRLGLSATREIASTERGKGRLYAGGVFGKCRSVRNLDFRDDICGGLQLSMQPLHCSVTHGCARNQRCDKNVMSLHCIHSIVEEETFILANPVIPNHFQKRSRQ